MKQASGFECLVFDPFSFQQDGLAAPKVNISRRQVGYAFVISQVIVVADEVSNLLFEIAGQIVVLKQDAILECLMPSLDLCPVSADAWEHHVCGPCLCRSAMWPIRQRCSWSHCR